MKNCDGIRTLAPLYLSGEMEPKDRDAFEAHLASCPVCASKIAEDRKLDAALRSALDGFAPDTGRLERVVRRKVSMDRSRRHWARAGAIAAAAALLTAAAIAWQAWTRPPRWYADAALDHRKEVIEGQPRHWRYSPSELARLAEQNELHLAQATGMAIPG
jgi:anti-sigma factor RsiW